MNFATLKTVQITNKTFKIIFWRINWVQSLNLAIKNILFIFLSRVFYKRKEVLPHALLLKN